MKPTIAFQLVHPDAKLPEYATRGSAGADIFSVENNQPPEWMPRQGVVLEPGERRLFKSGLKAEIPPGFVIFVYAKSGRALKEGITMGNGVGVIDSDYRGEFGALLQNTSDAPVFIAKGEKIAQLVVMPVEQARFVVADKPLSETERGEGGFGSTGLQGLAEMKQSFFGDP